MKKIVLSACMIIFATTLVSCKKEYQCSCTMADGTVVDNVYLNKFNKKEADTEKSKCETTTGCMFGRTK